MKILFKLLLILFSIPAIAQDSAFVKSAPEKRDGKKQDAFIRQHLVGKWKDQNSTMYFYPDGKFFNLYDDSTKIRGFWDVRKNKLTFKIMPSSFVLVYKVLSFSPTKMEIQSKPKHLDSTIWIANKVGRFEHGK